MNKEQIINNIFNSISRAIAKHKSIAEVLGISVDMIFHFFKVDLCNIYIYCEREKKLILRATKGFDKDLIGKIKLSVNEGLVGLVYSQREQLQVLSPHQMSQFHYIAKTKEERFNSFMGFPILLSDKCWGVLTLQCYEERILSEYDKKLALVLSDRLATILFYGSGKVESAKNEPRKGLSSLRGTPISGGVALGKAYIHKSCLFWDNIVFEKTDQQDKELTYFHRAIESAKSETLQIQERATKIFIETDASIFLSQLLFLEDPVFIKEIEKLITQSSQTALSAVKTVVEKQIDIFLSQDNKQLADRVVDLRDIGIRVAKHLVEDFDVSTTINLNNQFILVVEDLMPSDLMSFELKNILGIICHRGGTTSHAAILARSLGIPVVMGVSDVFSHCTSGMMVLLDANKGEVHLNVKQPLIEKYDNINDALEKKVEHKKDKEPCFTSDGKKINLQANINLSRELNMLKNIYHSGVGLYRSEFMFMVHDKFPSETEQYRIYDWLADNVDELITIRILDIGGDKQLPYYKMNDDDSSMLGRRSIRLLFDKKEIFVPHLRALLRVGQRTNVRLLFPMVACGRDMKRINNWVDDVLAQLQKQSDTKLIRPQIGAMIEIPSAVWQIESILEYADFVSIGSNDLIQYLFAVDRSNQKISSYYNPLHPAVLQAIDYVVKACQRLQKSISICGEMASSEKCIALLIGLGLTNLSMTPNSINSIRKIIKSLDVNKCVKLAQEALKCSTAEQVDKLVANFTK